METSVKNGNGYAIYPSYYFTVSNNTQSLGGVTPNAKSSAAKPGIKWVVLLASHI